MRGHLEVLILSVLQRGEAHGLEILRRLEITAGGLLHLKEGTLYPALYRLEAANKVEAVWEESTHGRRGARRRIYRLTPKGKKELEKGREEWVSFVSVVGNFLGATT